MVVGEIANFAAYAFAPAILVTPLGALSVLIGYGNLVTAELCQNLTPSSAVLGSVFLGEKLGILGKIGCAICLIGSLVIVLHAPPDRDIKRIDELLHFAIQPGMYPHRRRKSRLLTSCEAFVIYSLLVIIFAVVMIYKISPKYGRTNPLVYLSICSTVGSLSIMAIKGFGIAVKLTLSGSNQFVYPSTYVFMIVVVVCILTQMNYFNKALSQFSTNM